MSRRRRLESSFDMVANTMNLRPPQMAALHELRDVLLRLPKSLSHCTADEARPFLEFRSDWSHPFHPTFTIALATGVGKTRLAGAIMAMLWLSNEARTFLLLAPRRAVLRRLEDAMNPRFREYIFIDPNFIPEPLLIRADEIDTPRAVVPDMDLLAEGPRVYLLSPQLITSSERFRCKQEFADQSPADALQRARDLVVLVDEAHHVGRIGQAETAAWSRSIRELEPRLQIGLTATPRQEEGTNLLFEYPLRQALLDGYYTKKVKVLVRHFPESWGMAEDIDHTTIDFALQRLQSKQRALAAIRDVAFPPVKAVLVVFARDVNHAEEIKHWLIGTTRLTEEELLVTHSRMSKSEDDIERLLSIESLTNPVKCVLNVMELTEGWDVTNVYVVAPLRAMATFTGALQAIGRGLRLPAGRRIGDTEVDALDVVCFGKQTLEQIIRDATEWSGKGAIPTAGMEVLTHDAPSTHVATLMVPVRREVELIIAHLNIQHSELSLDIAPSALSRVTETVVEGLELAAARVRIEGMSEHPRLERRRFVDAVVSRTLREMSTHLSDEKHRGILAQVVEEWLDSVEPNEELIAFDPVTVSSEISSVLGDQVRYGDAIYRASGNSSRVVFPKFTCGVEVGVADNKTAEPIVSLSDLPELRSRSEFVPRRPYRGWNLALHEAYHFDSWHEAKVARLLDQAQGVQWWVRNEPRRLTIPTPAGNFSPDFLFCTAGDGKDRIHDIALMEVKGDLYWDPPNSEPRLKASAASAWCGIQSEGQSKISWRFVLARESDIDAVESWAALEPRLIVEEANE